MVVEGSNIFIVCYVIYIEVERMCVLFRFFRFNLGSINYFFICVFIEIGLLYYGFLLINLFLIL